jgi:prepilin peptidase CpaA
MPPFFIGTVFVVVVAAAIIDLRTRRIPNLLTLPALAAGVAGSAVMGGFAGIRHSLVGILVAILILGPLVWFRTMGAGDLKLCAAVGSWIGPAELLFALLIAAMAGGVMAVAYALCKGKLGVLLDRSAHLIRIAPVEAPQPDGDIRHPGALAIPYAPAIAFGVVFSLFAS